MCFPNRPPGRPGNLPSRGFRPATAAVSLRLRSRRHRTDRAYPRGGRDMGRFLLLAAGGRPTQNLSIFDPVSPPAESIRHLSVLVLAITGLIFVVVEGILLYSVF